MIVRLLAFSNQNFPPHVATFREETIRLLDEVRVPGRHAWALLLLKAIPADPSDAVPRLDLCCLPYISCLEDYGQSNTSSNKCGMCRVEPQHRPERN